ncbi:hypothetical protein JVT61DRAFT_9800 [Boletus reticuloceps]|uniref:CHAT domain-containing protein n=1 Tax=Boletus reticuloceps TaxID=495285 RepID=A0A8I3A5K2_9AGAM|nr:hypothetical protein JVT61DRAFT_9800 [Boletus reticuloceps]
MSLTKTPAGRFWSLTCSIRNSLVIRIRLYSRHSCAAIRSQLTCCPSASLGLPIEAELEYTRDIIRNLPSARFTLLEPSDGPLEEVLGLMKGADRVHFACHGIQDGVDSDIVALARPHGGFALLSACRWR